MCTQFVKTLNSQQKKIHFQASYFDALHKRECEFLTQKQNEAIEFDKTQRENAEYEMKMAAEKFQNTLRVKQDLERQMEEKNHERVHVFRF